MNLRHFLKFTYPGRLVAIPYRFFVVAMPHILQKEWQATRWTFASREHYNHTYHLTPLNRDYLDSYVSVVTGHSLALIQKYAAELEQDQELKQALRRAAEASPERFNSDTEPRYGRRIGWYSMVRATKPRVIVETGVDRGLGTAVMAAAVRRNAEEGFPGMVYATDIIPTCGFLIPQNLKPYCKILLGDSVESLKKLDLEVDIFLHDSDHRPEYEWAEFVAVEPRLHPASLVLSDNSQQTGKLLEFANRIGKSFLYFQDQPRDHWWPGDGIGAAFVPGRKTLFQGGAGQV